MDGSQFDNLVRSITHSRRSVVAGTLATLTGLLAVTGLDAKKKHRKKKRLKRTCKPNCTDRTCGKDGCGGSCGTCDADQVCDRGTCCLPESRGATCAGRCGTWTNNCGQPVECATCADGQTCLSNGSCAIVCDDNADCTGGSCTGGCSNPSVEGERHCINGFLPSPVTCATTADCPPGSHCQNLGAADGECIPLCA